MTTGTGPTAHTRERRDHDRTAPTTEVSCYRDVSYQSSSSAGSSSTDATSAMNREIPSPSTTR
jgi:hypothetical protein